MPIAEDDAIEGEKVEESIRIALDECTASEIEGPEVTPFLLKRITELTGGASLESNIRLVKNNARVGCQIAQALSAIMSKGDDNV